MQHRSSPWSLPLGRACLLIVAMVVLPGHLCNRPSRQRLLVSNEDSGDISVIDLERDEVVGTVAVGKRPRGIRAAGDGRSVFVALSGSPKAGPHVDEAHL